MKFVPTIVSLEEQTAAGKLGKDTLKDLTKKCVTSIIVLGQNKSVIKRIELNKLIKSGNELVRITPLTSSAILALASQQLEKHLGMRLFEVDDQRDKYLLVNGHIDFNEYRNYTPEETDELVVLFLLMVVIFTSAEESASEDELRKAVTEIIHSDTEFKKILDSLSKKLYLIQTKDSKRQGVKLYAWGPRAYAETHADNFFSCFMELVGEGNEDDWPEQKRRLEKLKKLHERRA